MLSSKFPTVIKSARSGTKKAAGFALSDPECNEEFKEELFVEVRWIFKNFDNPIDANNIEYSGIFNTTAQRVTVNYEKLLIEISQKLVA